MTGEVDEIAGRGEDALGTLGHLPADVGRYDVARPPLEKIGADRTLQGTDLHRERRLGHGALLGGASEMPMPRERDEITQLSQRNHGDKLFLWRRPINTIRPDRNIAR